MKVHALFKLKRKEFKLAELILNHACYLCARTVEKGWTAMVMEWGGLLLYLGAVKQEQKKLGLPITQEEVENIFKEADHKLTKKTEEEPKGNRLLPPPPCPLLSL